MKRTEIVLASHNPGKCAELSALLKDLSILLRPQSDFGIQEIAETGSTFIENALIKARHAAEKSGLPALADDSGLVVPALDGAPGIYSARFAGEEARAEDNIKKLLAAMALKKNRAATFYCILVFIKNANDPVPIVAEGRWHGLIANEAKGTHGFGYDPVFYVPALQKTAAELSSILKNKISHRAIAMKLLLEQLSDQLCMH